MGILDRLRGAFRAAEKTVAAGGGRRIADVSNAPEFIYVPNPDHEWALATYAYREWISTAIDRVAELCVSVPVVVVEQDGLRRFDGHPLLRMLGQYGQANRHQDSFEFMESHFKRMDIFGNDVWYWVSDGGGAPDEVYQLDLRYLSIRIRNGVQWYFYRVGGVVYEISPEQVTHFRRSNVTSSGAFWGMSAIEKLRSVAATDGMMSRFNQQFFSTGAPSGILIVDSADVSGKEARRIEAEFHATADAGRRMAVIRAAPGSAVWHEAGAKQRDMDFKEGRLLTRQAAFDALGFHVGAVSEASTEAHARVAESLVRESAWVRHQRTASRLNSVLEFWGMADRYQVSFGDVRATDWDKESKKLEAVSPFMTINEVRGRYLELEPVPGGERFAVVEKGALNAGDNTRGQ